VGHQSITSTLSTSEITAGESGVTERLQHSQQARTYSEMRQSLEHSYNYQPKHHKFTDLISSQNKRVTKLPSEIYSTLLTKRDQRLSFCSTLQQDYSMSHLLVSEQQVKGDECVNPWLLQLTCNDLHQLLLLVVIESIDDSVAADLWDDQREMTEQCAAEPRSAPPTFHRHTGILTHVKLFPAFSISW